MTTLQVCLQPSKLYEADLLRDAFEAAGAFTAEDGHCCSVVWAQARAVDWNAAIDGRFFCNALPVCTGLTRKANLAELLSLSAQDGSRLALAAASPETHIISDGSDIAVIDGVLANCPDRTWILKHSELSRGRGLFVLGANEANGRQSPWRTAVHTDPGPWVLQAYVPRLLLLSGRKCHLRAHVLLSGCTQVWLSDHVLVLPAVKPFESTAEATDLLVHASNHAFQKRNAPGGAHHASTLTLQEACAGWAAEPCAQEALRAAGICTEESRDLQTVLQKHLRSRVSTIVTELFDAALTSKSNRLSVYPLHNCCQLFGIDMLLDQDLQLHVLEVNADPSLDIFGTRLRAECAAMLRDVAAVICDDARTHFSGSQNRSTETPQDPESTASVKSPVGPQARSGDRAAGVGSRGLALVCNHSSLGTFADRQRRARALFHCLGSLAHGGDAQWTPRSPSSPEHNKAGWRAVAVDVGVPGGAELLEWARRRSISASTFTKDVTATLLFAKRQAMAWDRMLAKRVVCSNHIASTYTQGTPLAMFRLCLAACEKTNALAPCALLSCSWAQKGGPGYDSVMALMSRSTCWRVLFPGSTAEVLDLRQLLLAPVLTVEKVCEELCKHATKSGTKAFVCAAHDAGIECCWHEDVLAVQLGSSALAVHKESMAVDEAGSMGSGGQQGDNSLDAPACKMAPATMSKSGPRQGEPDATLKLIKAALTDVLKAVQKTKGHMATPHSFESYVCRFECSAGTARLLHIAPHWRYSACERTHFPTAWATGLTELIGDVYLGSTGFASCTRPGCEVHGLEFDRLMQQLGDMPAAGIWCFSEL